MEAASTALGRAQALLDPTGNGLFSTARLMPYLNIAYSSMRDEGISQREITAAEAVLVLANVAAGTTDLGQYVKPGGTLQNLANPIAIMEKPAGTDDDNYQEVARVTELIPRIQESYNLTYEWRGGNIFFIGATQNLDLQIRYEQLWPSIATPDQALSAVGIANILGYWTAGLMCAAMREQTLSAGYIAEAKHLIFLWKVRQVLDSQAITRRPQRFRPSGALSGNGLNGAGDGGTL
jgi:hypothetical protein